MNSDIRSAGTVVAAILENMGLVTQERILRDFHSFFQSGGAIIFLLVCMAALISLVLFGSYRMGSYLLVGPGLFSFLLYTRTDVTPTTWKLGGSEAVSVEEDFIGPLEEYRPGQTVSVSWFFAWYTRIIDDFVNQTVDLILNNEDNEKLLFLTRDHVLRLIRTAVPMDEGLASVVVEDLTGPRGCLRMMNVLTAFTQDKYSDYYLGALDQRINIGTNGDVFRAERDQIIREMEALRAQLTLAEREAISASSALRKFIGSYAARYATTLGSSSETRADSDLFVERDLPNLTLTCNQVWTVTKDFILNDSGHTLSKILRDLKVNIEVNTENERALCIEVADKLHKRYFVRTEGQTPEELRENCDLTQVVGLFLLRNIISNAHGLRRNLQNSLDRTQVLESQRVIYFNDNQGMTGKNDDDLIVNLGAGKELKTKMDDQGRYVAYDERLNQYRTFDRATIFGFMESLYRYQQSYRTAELLQKLFTYALHLPYWQGVLLYLLSIAFPFSCILVLMPNRVSLFLLMPVFWLWVKSWDIGFAMVMVLDRMIWNLLPSSDAPYNSFSSNASMVYGGSPSDDATALVRAVMSVDPLFHVHMKYHYLSVVMFVIPAITGWVLLKSKRAILASFTDAPKEHTEHTGQMARQAYEVGMMHDLMQELYRFSDAVAVSQTKGDGLLSAYGNSFMGKSQAHEQATTMAAIAFAGKLGGSVLGEVLGNTKQREEFKEALADSAKGGGSGGAAGGGSAGGGSGGGSAAGGGGASGSAKSFASRLKSNPKLQSAVANTGGDLVGAAATALNTYNDFMRVAMRRQIVEQYYMNSSLGRLGSYPILMEAAMTAAADGAGFETIAYNSNPAQSRLAVYWEMVREERKVYAAAAGQLLSQVGAKLNKAVPAGGEALSRNPTNQAFSGTVDLVVGGVTVALPAGLAEFFREEASGEELGHVFGLPTREDLFGVQMYNQGHEHGFAPTPGLSHGWDSPRYVQHGEKRNLHLTPFDYRYEVAYPTEEEQQIKEKRKRGYGFWENFTISDERLLKTWQHPQGH